MLFGMANLPRYALIHDSCVWHVTWQCHNKDWLLEPDWAKKIYYNLLLKYKDRYRVSIYSYCFMSNHPHMTGFCEDKNLFSDFFRVVNSLFAKTYNKNMGRRGQVVMDRFKSPRIQTDGDLIKVMLYNDLNPKRAHMVLHPQDYRWSSFHYYAYGKKDSLITPAPSYLGLGFNDEQRQEAYLAMIEEILKADWKEKKPYSSACFIGNPDWVKDRSKQLAAMCYAKHRAWQERYRERFNNSSS